LKPVNLYFRKYRKLWCYGFLTILAIIILVAAGLILRSDKKTHLTAIPVPGEYTYLNFALANVINQSFEHRYGDAVTVHDLTWFKGGIQSDLQYTKPEMVQFGVAAGLDYLVLTNVNNEISKGVFVNFRCLDVKHARFIFSGSDSILFNNPHSFLHHLEDKLEKICNLVADAGNSDRSIFPTDWKKLGTGRFYELSGNPDKSLEAYRCIMSKDSLILPIRNYLAQGLLKKGLLNKQDGEFPEDSYSTAEQILKRTVFLYPDSYEALRLLGRLYLQRNGWNRAEYYLKLAFKKKNDDPDILMDISRLHESRLLNFGYKSRLNIYRRCLKLNPVMLSAVLEIGNFYYFQNRQKKAEKIYKKFLDFNPESIDALMAIGKIYVHKNDVLKIVSTYMRILEIDPKYAAAYYNLGIAYFNDEKPHEAIRFFKKALELGGTPYNNYYLGVIHARLGLKEEAVEFFRKRIKQRTGHDDVYAEEARKILYQLLNNESFKV